MRIFNWEGGVSGWNYFWGSCEQIIKSNQFRLICFNLVPFSEDLETSLHSAGQSALKSEESDFYSRFYLNQLTLRSPYGRYLNKNLFKIIWKGSYGFIVLYNRVYLTKFSPQDGIRGCYIMSERRKPQTLIWI